MPRARIMTTEKMFIFAVFWSFVADFFLAQFYIRVLALLLFTLFYKVAVKRTLVQLLLLAFGSHLKSCDRFLLLWNDRRISVCKATRSLHNFIIEF
jgi:hypothetical protein